MEEGQEVETLAEILARILAQDHSLLSRREEILSLLESQVTGAQMRDFRSFEKALLGTTIGESLYAADQRSAKEKIHAKASAEQALKSLGMQDQAIGRVISSITMALGWTENLEEAEREEEISVPADEMPGNEIVYSENASDAFSEDNAMESHSTTSGDLSWACCCGHIGNKGRFCVACGTSRDEGEVNSDNLWNCLCGKKNNHGRFCTQCGRSRVEGERLDADPEYWDCICGKKRNVGNFCTQCGKSRADGQVALWNCLCGHTGNKGRFCISCGRSKAEGLVP